jgi:hypothetical protein
VACVGDNAVPISVFIVAGSFCQARVRKLHQAIDTSVVGWEVPHEVSQKVENF